MGEPQSMVDVCWGGGRLHIASGVLVEFAVGCGGDAGGELPLHQCVDLVWHSDWPLAEIPARVAMV